MVLFLMLASALLPKEDYSSQAYLNYIPTFKNCQVDTGHYHLILSAHLDLNQGPLGYKPSMGIDLLLAMIYTLNKYLRWYAVKTGGIEKLLC